MACFPVAAQQQIAARRGHIAQPKVVKTVPAWSNTPAPDVVGHAYTTGCLEGLLADLHSEPKKTDGCAMEDEPRMKFRPAPPPPRNMTVAQAELLMQRSLTTLGPVAEQVWCSVAQKELSAAPLRQLGFAAVQGAAEEGGLDPAAAAAAVAAAELGNPFAVLVASVGTDTKAAQAAVSSFHALDSCVLAVLMVPFLGCAGLTAPTDPGCSMRDGLLVADPGNAELGVELARRIAKARHSLLEAGADDVITLFAGETLTPHRLLESVQKSECLSQLMVKEMEAQVAVAKDTGQKMMAAAPKKWLMGLIGDGFDSIPVKDTSLKEALDTQGLIVTVGGYDFEAKLGEGTFGQVFKSRRPEGGRCAVKVFHKARMSVDPCLLQSINQEIAILLHLERHPNIIGAFTALHSQSGISVVMDYAGAQHLQRFSKRVLLSTGERALPAKFLVPFCKQQAAAVSHLHNLMVCHRDLKAENWIVGDSGNVLRLADFGCATQLAGPLQLLTLRCGSLPFCAPEVHCVGKGGPGYEGPPADMWSLGANWVELLGGPLSIDRLLGWSLRPPDRDETVHEGLSSLAVRWVEIPRAEASPLGKIVGRMLVLDPARRAKIGQVVGTEGLDLDQAPRPPRTARSRPSRPWHSNPA